MTTLLQRMQEDMRLQPRAQHQGAIHSPRFHVRAVLCQITRAYRPRRNPFVSVVSIEGKECCAGDGRDHGFRCAVPLQRDIAKALDDGRGNTVAKAA
jgi:hypothetical protein